MVSSLDKIEMEVVAVAVVAVGIMCFCGHGDNGDGDVGCCQTRLLEEDGDWKDRLQDDLCSKASQRLLDTHCQAGTDL